MPQHHQGSVFGSAARPGSASQFLLQLHPNPDLHPCDVLSNKGPVPEILDFIVVPGILDRRDRVNYGRWLHQLLSKDLPESRILLFVYDALHIFGQARLFRAAWLFLELLVEKRKHDPFRPIIFVAYSVGGIFLKYALVQTWKDPKFHSIRESSRGIAFFGTPHRGFSDDMSMEGLVRIIARRLLVLPPTTTTTTADPPQDNRLLSRKMPSSQRPEAAATVHGRWLDEYRKQLRIVSFYETTPAVVSKLEAVLGLSEPDECAVPLAMSHMDMDRFSSQQDAQYQLVIAHLASLVASARQSAPERGDLGGRELLWFRFLYPDGLSSREDRIGKPAYGTCRWIFRDPSFKEWLTPGGNPLLYIEGKPGSGKSTLARFLQRSLSSSIRVASDRSEPSLLRFFSDAYSPPKSAESVLRMMLHQAVTSKPHLLRFVAKDLRQSRNWSRSLTQSLGSTISHLAKHQEFIVFLDGLDESEDQVGWEVVEALYESDPPGPHRMADLLCGCEQTRPCLKVLLTSRHQVRSRFTSPVNLVDLSSGEAAVGIQGDVRSILGESLRLRPQISRPAKLDILDRKLMNLVLDVTERAAGVFLWVHLVLSILKPERLKRRDGLVHDTAKMLVTVSNMPDDLQDLYRLLLNDIRGDMYRLRALEWVLCAKRPLKLEELSTAINIDLAPPSPPDVPWIEFQRPFPPSPCAEMVFPAADCARIMSPLLVVEGSSVQFIHPTVKDFLMSHLSQPLMMAPKTYASRINNHLFLSCAKALHDTNEDDQLARYEFERPLSLYAATHWYYHFQSYTDTSASQRSEMLRSLCSPRSRLLPSWFPTWWGEKWSQGWEMARCPRYPTEGIVLAFLGNEPELKSLLQRRIVRAGECTVKGEEWTPLMAAAWSGHEAVAALLLSWHPGYERHPRLSARALMHAIDHGHTAIAQMLTMAFAAPTPRLTPSPGSLNAFVGGDSPLHAAVRRGSREMVSLLLDAGADVNLCSDATRPASGSSPLARAICRGYDVAIVQLLLENGAHLDSHALSLACDSDDSDVVWVVSDELRRRSDGNGLVWESGPDALARLRFETKLQNKRDVTRLLELGADPALPDISGVSALQTACQVSWVDGVQLFHKLSRDGSASTVMFLAACQHAVVDVVKALLDLGVSPNSFETVENRSAIHHVVSGNSRALLASSQQRRVVVMELLVAAGADVNQPDTWGDTGLHLASRQREERIASLLVHAGADTCAKNSDGATALDLAARNGDTSIMDLLLSQGSPVQVATWRSALVSGNIDAVRCILGHLSASSRQRKSRGLEARPPLEPMPYEIARHFVLGGDAPPRFQQAIKYLRSSHLLESPRIELSFSDRLSFTDVLKAWWEKTTYTKWHWWPLAPPIPFLTSEEAWIRWSCGPGMHKHRVKIPIDLAIDIKDLFQYQTVVCSLTEPLFYRDFPAPNPRALVASTRYPSTYIYSGVHAIETEASIARLDTTSRIPSVLTTWKRALSGLYQHAPVRTCPGSGPERLELAQRNPLAQSTRPCPAGSGSRGLEDSESQQQQQQQQQHRGDGGTRPSGQDPAPDPNRDPNSEATRAEPPRKGRWVHLKPHRYSELKSLDVLGWHDMQFCEALRAQYLACRSSVRKYLSIMRFHHWGFDKFEYTGRGPIHSTSNGNRNDVYLPGVDDVDYDFVRLNSRDGGAPVSQVVFCAHYYLCARDCRVPGFLHSCNARPSPPIPDEEVGGRRSPVLPVAVDDDDDDNDGRVLPYVPKRYERWEPSEIRFEAIYGLTAFELPSFLGFLAYSFFAAVAAAIFWAVWLSVLGHPSDLQNAAIPAFIFVALWVASLQTFRDRGWNRFEEC